MYDVVPAGGSAMIEVKIYESFFLGGYDVSARLKIGTDGRTGIFVKRQVNSEAKAKRMARVLAEALQEWQETCPEVLKS